MRVERVRGSSPPASARAPRPPPSGARCGVAGAGEGGGAARTERARGAPQARRPRPPRRQGAASARSAAVASAAVERQCRMAGSARRGRRSVAVADMASRPAGRSARSAAARPEQRPGEGIASGGAFASPWLEQRQGGAAGLPRSIAARRMRAAEDQRAGKLAAAAIMTSISTSTSPSAQRRSATRQARREAAPSSLSPAPSRAPRSGGRHESRELVVLGVDQRVRAEVRGRRARARDGNTAEARRAEFAACGGRPSRPHRFVRLDREQAARRRYARVQGADGRKPFSIPRDGHDSICRTPIASASIASAARDRQAGRSLPTVEGVDRFGGRIVAMWAKPGSGSACMRSAGSLAVAPAAPRSLRRARRARRAAKRGRAGTARAAPGFPGRLSDRMPDSVTAPSAAPSAQARPTASRSRSTTQASPLGSASSRWVAIRSGAAPARASARVRSGVPAAALAVGGLREDAAPDERVDEPQRPPRSDT